MNIRKHWKKFLIASTTLFWASCGSDSESTTAPQVQAPESSAAITSSETVEPGSSEEVANSSETGSIESSSDAVQSSSSEGYKGIRLARDTSVTCVEMSNSYCAKYYSPSSPDQERSKEIRDQLRNNTTKTLEELNDLEDTLETISYEAVALYGVASCERYESTPVYVCSNVGTLYGDSYKVKDNLLYSSEEYNEKFPSSSSNAPSSDSSAPESSSVEPESSSSEAESSSSAELPSPLCTKGEFIGSYEIRNEFAVQRDSIVNRANRDLDDTTRVALSGCFSKITFNEDKAQFEGLVAKYQTCDGETIVNPRYQAKLDSNEAYIQKKIDDCQKEPE